MARPTPIVRARAHARALSSSVASRPIVFPVLLVNQTEALYEFLDANPALGQEFPFRQLDFVVDHVDRVSLALRSSMNSDPKVNRKTWNELLSNTKRAHKDFLARVNTMQSGSPLAIVEE